MTNIGAVFLLSAYLLLGPAIALAALLSDGAESVRAAMKSRP